jgi:hypothetical protein
MNRFLKTIIDAGVRPEMSVREARTARMKDNSSIILPA